MSTEDKFKFSELRTSLIIMGIFWVVAIVLWQTSRNCWRVLKDCEFAYLTVTY